MPSAPTSKSPDHRQPSVSVTRTSSGVCSTSRTEESKRTLDRAAQILVDRAGQVTSQQAEQSAVQRSHHPLIVKGRSRSPVPIDVVQLVHLVGDLPQAGQEAHGFCRLEAGTEEVDDVALLPQGIRPLDYIRFPPQPTEHQSQGQTTYPGPAISARILCNPSSSLPERRRPRHPYLIRVTHPNRGKWSEATTAGGCVAIAFDHLRAR